MERIMIDMDDVICEGGFLSLVNQFLNTDYKKDDIKTYYIQDVIPKERFDEWIEFFNSKSVYDYVEFLEDAYEVMEKLSKKYELYVCSNYMFRDNAKSSGKNLKDKYDWLYKNIPFISPENYIFLTNKQILDCQIKIDDKLSNLEGLGQIKLLLTTYHNKNISDDELKEKNVQRVNNWKEIEKVLL